mgnify:FL=1
MYVQHRIRESGELLAELILSQNAVVYVSGRAKFMPKSVEKAFRDVIGSAMGVSDHDADPRATQYIAQMKKQRRYQQEVW